MAYNQSEIIEKFKKIHGDRYGYNNFEFKGIKIPSLITCHKHGDFLQSAQSHLRGSNCKKCMYQGGRKLPFALDTQKFKIKSAQVHNSFYDYSLSDYKTNKDKIKIICPVHGVFEQRPDRHMQGDGCIQCAGNYQYTKEDFVNKCSPKHVFKFDYSKVVYVNNDSKVEIICPIHGSFSIIAKDHLRGIGCWNCSESKGEVAVLSYLTQKDIKFCRQQRFSDCVGMGNRRLPFDFYVPNCNLLIEYDGPQHFLPQQIGGVSKEKAIINFERCQRNDQIKTNYCLDNGMDLLRIPYTYFNKINETLTDKLINGINPVIDYPLVKNVFDLHFIK